MKVIWLLAGPLGFFLIFGFSPLGLEAAPAAVLGLTLWMLIWWVFECVPLPVTALLPILILPAFGSFKVDTVTKAYGSDIIYLFLSGFLVSRALEKWELHKKIGEWCIYALPPKPHWLMLGFMGVTAFASMWISNTAAALIMIPMAQAYSKQLGDRGEQGLLLGIAYAASIGGLGTIIGSPPNGVLVSYLTSIEKPLSFVEFSKIGVPLAILGTLLCWAYLSTIFLRGAKQNLAGPPVDRPQKLSAPQVRCVVVFLAGAAAWVLRSIFEVPGTSDAGVGVLIVLTLFIVPSGQSQTALLSSHDLKKLPWSILLLFGGGLALSLGFSQSGLGNWLASFLGFLSELPLFVSLLIVCALVMAATELGSNTAVAAIFVPLLGQVALSAQLPVLPVCFAVTAAASLSFMLPMATPPNAFVHGLGVVSLRQMMRVGAGLNVLFSILIAAFCAWVIPVLF
jgi:sodium-dependent dicarboxylate transporter 2/3/5